MTASSIALMFRRNWFVPLAASLLTVVWLVGRTFAPGDWRTLEPALIFDSTVTLPALYWLCYRKALSGKAMAVRLVALVCAGLFVASWLVPQEEQRLLAQVAPLRIAGIAVVVLVELALLIAVLRVMFRKGTTTDQLQTLGMPPLIARLMLLEARFWRWLFAKFKR